MDSVFDSSVNNVVPWQANYTFPTQATKIHKQTTKFPPKNGSSFGTGSGLYRQIRIELPSDGYLNMLNSTLLMDVAIGTSKVAFEGTLTATKGALTSTYAAGPPVAVTTTQAATTLRLVASGSQSLTAYSEDDALVGGFLEIKQGPSSQGRVFQIVSHTTLSDRAFAAIVLVPTDGGRALTDFGTVDGNAWSVKFHSGTRLQEGGAHELIKSIRILYGGLVLEEIRSYSLLARQLLNATNQGYRRSGGRILDGVVGENHMQSSIGGAYSASTAVPIIGSNSALRGQLDLASSTHRYSIKPFSGILSSKKLIPLKWMAAQFVIEINLAESAEALIGTVCEGSTVPSYTLTNVNFLAELMEFDSTFDTGFFVGLRESGVPIKFQSWNHHVFNVTGSRVTAQIMERARSVKSALAIVQDTGRAFQQDTNRGFYDINCTFAAGTTTTLNGNWTRSPDTSVPLLLYQFRIGGKYFPAQPVDCQYGASEAFIEYLKVMDGLGDYTYTPSIDGQSWSGTHSFVGGDKFLMAAEFEHADVFPDTISGINSAEQSDMALQMQWDGVPPANKAVNIFVAYDALLVVRDSNLVNLIV